MKTYAFANLAMVAVVLGLLGCGEGGKPAAGDGSGDRPVGSQDAARDVVPQGSDARDAGPDDDRGQPDLSVADVGVPDVVLDQGADVVPDVAPDAAVDGAAHVDVAPDVVSDAAPADVTPAADTTTDSTGADGTTTDGALTDGALTDGACGSPTDPKNCGTCGHDCTILAHVRGDKVACVAGACSIPAGACQPGYANCTADPERGCESDITRDIRCGCAGACAQTTPLCATPAAGAPMCVATCAGTGLTACGRQCVDPQTNSRHCGTCGASCDSGNGESVCVAGKCAVVRCFAGYADCDPATRGCETTLGTFYNCGSCGGSCGAAHATGTCAASACARVCHAGYGNCDRSNPDCEAPLDTAANCGGCGTKCPSDRPLCGGARGQETCRAACAAPVPDACGTSCTDLQTDPRHCGTCGTVCDGYQVCKLGRCSPRYVKTDVMPASAGIQLTMVVIAADGSYFVGGDFTAAVDFDPGPATDMRTPVTNADTFLVRFNADGTFAWARTWPIGGFIGGVALAADGSVVVSGAFSGSVDFNPGAGVTSLSARGSSDPYVMKLGVTGELVWVRSLVMTVEDVAAGDSRGVTVGADGSILVAGMFRGRIDLDPGGTSDFHTSVASTFDGYVVKLSASGTFIWGRSFGGAMEDGTGPIAVDTSGMVWLGGSFGGTVDLDPGPGMDAHTAVGESDAFLVRLDGSGTYLDSRTFGDGNADYLSAIVFDDDGSTYVGGTTNHADDTTAAFLQKLNAAGVQVWLKRYESTSTYGATAAPGGGVLMLDGGPAVPAGTEMKLVTKLDRDGNEVWSIPAPPFSAYVVTKIAADATNLLICGVLPQGAAVDLDPGAGAAAATGPGAAITRYAF